MKKLAFIIIALFMATAGYTQVIYNDNWPLPGTDDMQLEYGLIGSKWNKTALKYYIYNTSAHLTAAQRETIIQTAFQRWSAVSALSFTQVSSPSSADIKIKWVTGDHGDGKPFDGTNDSILAHAFSPGSIYYAGEVHFDDGDPWIVEGSGLTGYLLLHAAIHEIGHALGIAHSNVAGSIMLPKYTGQTTLGSDDILAICNLYGGAPISGPSTVCSDNTTFTSPYPQGTYTWNQSSNLTIVSTSGNTAAFTSNGIDPAWVSILVNGTEVTRKTVDASRVLQTADFSGSCGGPETGSSGLFFGSVRSSYSVDEFEWSTDPGWTVVSHPDFPSNIPMGNVRITRTSSSAYTTTTVWVRARNGCGWSSGKQVGTLSSSSYYTVSAYPNPVSDVLNLLIEEEETGGSSRTGVKPVYTIHLYSIMGGTPVLQTSANEAGTVQLNVGSLPDGIYVLHVHDGTENPPLTQRIVISH
jgi:predicted Zn-dependent protease